MRPFVVLVLLAACSRETPCQRAVAHVTRVVLQVGGASGGEPAAAGVEKTMVARCEAEGLSEAQLRCILAIDGTDALMRLGACPAIAARSPAWLIAPAADERR